MSEIKKETAFDYIHELRGKYPEGSIIADVPSNKTGGRNGGLTEDIGKGIIGELILEVPVQKMPIPQNILDEAAKWNIVIKEVEY